MSECSEEDFTGVGKVLLVNADGKSDLCVASCVGDGVVRSGLSVEVVGKSCEESVGVHEDPEVLEGGALLGCSLFCHLAVGVVSVADCPMFVVSDDVRLEYSVSLGFYGVLEGALFAGGEGCERCLFGVIVVIDEVRPDGDEVVGVSEGAVVGHAVLEHVFEGC